MEACAAQLVDNDVHSGGFADGIPQWTDHHRGVGFQLSRHRLFAVEFDTHPGLRCSASCVLFMVFVVIVVNLMVDILYFLTLEFVSDFGFGISSWLARFVV